MIPSEELNLSKVNVEADNRKKKKTVIHHERIPFLWPKVHVTER